MPISGTTTLNPYKQIQKIMFLKAFCNGIHGALAQQNKICIPLLPGEYIIYNKQIVQLTIYRNELSIASWPEPDRILELLI